MVKMWIIVMVLFTFSGCTFKSNGFNPNYIEGAKKFNNTKVNIKVVTSDRDDNSIITKYPTPYVDKTASILKNIVKSGTAQVLFSSNPGSGNKIAFDTGAVAKGISKAVFENQISLLNNREILIRPYVVDLDYHYEVANNGFLANSPSIDNIKMTFTAIENNQTILDKTYMLESSVDGKIFFSDTGEKFNEVFHKALLKLIENASDDLSRLVGNKYTN